MLCQNFNRSLKILASVLIGLSVIGLGSFYIFGKKNLSQNEQPNPMVSDRIASSLQKNDAILINRRDGVYEINILTKELKPYSSPTEGIAEFAGLPKEEKNEKTSVSLTRIFLSEDKAKAIAVFTTFDETREPNDFDGSLPALKADEFTCDIATKKCSGTDLLASAYKATGLGDEWFDNRMLWWDKWDSEKNLFYGHLSGEGIGSAAPVYVFDFNNQSLQQTIGYNSLKEKEKSAKVPAGAFSPSLSKFVMVETSDGIWNLLLYENNVLSVPSKKYPISLADEAVGIESGIDAVAWSADERTIILGTHRQIFRFNLEDGEMALIYTDITLDEIGLWFDFNSVGLSSSGRYVVFVDYDKRRSSDSENKMEPVLKAIDLEDNNQVIELLREEGLSLYNRW